MDEALLHAICERVDDLPADTMTAVTVDDVRLSDITTEEDDDQTEAWNQIAAIFGFDWSPGQWDSAEGESETVQSVTARKDVRDRKSVV